MTRNTNFSRERGASNRKQNVGKNPCKFPVGVTIIGELGAKYWLLRNNTNQEGEGDAERIHGDDKNGTSVP